MKSMAGFKWFCVLGADNEAREKENRIFFFLFKSDYASSKI